MEVRKQLFISFLIVLFLIIGTVIVVMYGKGYRFGFDKGKPDFFGTGILAVSSSPQGAEVLIDGNLTTATNNNINLLPKEYDVKIQQRGYFSWEKKIKVEKEVVSKADALLFPTYPTLQSITSTGVTNPVIDPSYTKLAYTVASQSETDKIKNGIYVLDMGNRPLISLQSGATQIVSDDTAGDTFSKAALSWSPDGKNILVTITDNRPNPTSYLLDATTFNANPQNVTETLPTVIDTWEKEKMQKQTAQMASLKSPLQNLVNANFTILSWSPDETRILYQASSSANLPLMINPPLKGSDSTPQDRAIQKDNIYVYDIKEDKNFKILDAETAKQDTDNGQIPLAWLGDSNHLVYTHNKRIQVMDYDGSNQITIYAGPFIDHHVFPWPDNSKIAILTDLGNDQILPNLYTISLK